MTYPWTHLANEERDGTWADWSAWHEWVGQQMVPHAREEWLEQDDIDAWQENLYAVWCKLMDERDEEVERLRDVVRKVRKTLYVHFDPPGCDVWTDAQWHDQGNAFDADTEQLINGGEKP